MKSYWMYKVKYRILSNNYIVKAIKVQNYNNYKGGHIDNQSQSHEFFMHYKLYMLDLLNVVQVKQAPLDDW